MVQGRNAQRPEFAVGLRDEPSSDGIRSVGLLPERNRQFAEPPPHALRLDVRKVLTVHPRCALIGAALSVGMRPDVLSDDLVVSTAARMRVITFGGTPGLTVLRRNQPQY